MNIKKEWLDLLVENSGAIYVSLDITHLTRIVGSKEKAAKISNVFMKITASKLSKDSSEYTALKQSFDNFSSYMGAKDDSIEK